MPQAWPATADLQVMVRLFALLVVALVVGCRMEAPEPTLTPTVGVDAEIAEPALVALELWSDATGGAFAPDTHIGCDGSEDLCIRAVEGRVAKCDGDTDVRACTRNHLGRIELGTAVPVDQRVSTLAHELGHYLDLQHTEAGLMNPTRPESERRAACIDETTLDAFALAYGVDRASMAQRCLGL